MPKFEEKDIAENKLIAALSYLWILFLIPMLLKKESAFASWHAKQGLVLFIFEIIVSVIGIVPILGWLVSFVGMIFAVIVSLLGIVKAVGGQGYEVPWIGQYAKEFKI